VVVPKQSEKDNQLYYLPIRIINLSSKDVTLHKGMKVAKLELIQDPDFVAGLGITVREDTPATSVSTEVQELLWVRMEESRETLDSRQQYQLYQLLLRCILPYQ